MSNVTWKRGHGTACYEAIGVGFFRGVADFSLQQIQQFNALLLPGNFRFARQAPEGITAAEVFSCRGADSPGDVFQPVYFKSVRVKSVFPS